MMAPLSYGRARKVLSSRPADRFRSSIRSARSKLRRSPAGWEWGQVPDNPDDRITLAHAILVGTAGFAAFRDTVGRPVYDAAGISLWEQVMLMGEWSPDLALDCTDRLLQMDIPCPGQQLSFRGNLDVLRGYFGDLAHRCLGFVAGTSISGRARDSLPTTLPQMPDLALTQYQTLVRRLTADIPEFNSWLILNDMLTRDLFPPAAAIGRTPPPPAVIPPPRPADIHLVFAEDERAYAEAVATALDDAGLRTRLFLPPGPFLQGKRLLDRLRTIYGGSGRVSILFLSPEYGREIWQGHAYKQAHGQSLTEYDDHVLLIRFDSTTRVPVEGAPNWFADARLIDPVRLVARIRSEVI
ncbi:NACHT N-terminal helical domain 7-containing protein [Actinoplanes sp. HUAS TT8]|uniref:NACHT N-terminal helical domain 7-containing protein n=1 Tax=Actinoplanes sp. HUAS TT8 TaxID=3447453 RepID=UPI003F520180